MSLGDQLGTFRQVMDSASTEQMNQLCERFDGFYRFGKMLEMMAQGIQDGVIDVPKE